MTPLEKRHPVARQTTGVDTIFYLYLLKDAHVSIGLGHPAKRKHHSVIVSIPDIIGS